MRCSACRRECERNVAIFSSGRTKSGCRAKNFTRTCAVALKLCLRRAWSCQTAPRDAAHSTSKALPVRFTDRAQAEEICAELNRTKPKTKATQVSPPKNANNLDVSLR